MYLLYSGLAWYRSVILTLKKNWLPFDQQKNPNDLDILAFWLANTSRLLHDMKQYSGDKVSLSIMSIGSITDRCSHMEPTPPSRPYSRVRPKTEPTALKFTFNMISKGLTTHTSCIFNFFFQFVWFFFHTVLVKRALFLFKYTQSPSFRSFVSFVATVVVVFGDVLWYLSCNYQTNTVVFLHVMSLIVKKPISIQNMFRFRRISSCIKRKIIWMILH